MTALWLARYCHTLSVRIVKADLIVKAWKYLAGFGFGDVGLGRKVLQVYLLEVSVKVRKPWEFPLDLPKSMTH
jgi:hypothetical protein